LIMRQSAYLDRAGDVIRSDLIRLNTLTNGIEAGDSQSDKPVKMVIKPRKPAAKPPAGADSEQPPAND